MAEFIYTMRKARKAHGDKVILDDVTLSFLPGAKIGVVGPNGAGKSTVLKIMAGLDHASNGDAFLTPGFSVGILEQEPRLNEDKDVLGNVEEGLGEIKLKLDRYNEIAEKMAVEYSDELMNEMSALQEDIEHELSIRGSRCPSFPTHIFSWLGHDSADATGTKPIGEGECVMFDFGGVHSGYCSDFGRTVVAGEPPAGYLEAYAVMLEAQEAGRAALVPGALAREVNAACRGPIEAAGLGGAFRHRMGHGIGLDVHERPFLSPEDDTVLEEGMVFTDEPSILLDGDFGVRIEDVVVCADGGGRVLNRLEAGPLSPS